MFFCGNKKVRLPNYHWGVMKSNKDEYYSGECPKCYNTLYWEPNYDNVCSIGSHNMIVCGNYFKDYDKSEDYIKGNVSGERFNDIINKCKKYDIAEPYSLLNRMEVSGYIDEKL